MLCVTPIAGGARRSDRQQSPESSRGPLSGLAVMSLALICLVSTGCVSGVDPVLGSAQAYSTSSPAIPAEIPLQVVASVTTEGNLAQTPVPAPQTSVAAIEQVAEPAGSNDFPVPTVVAIPVPAPRNALATTGTDAALAFSAPLESPVVSDPAANAGGVPVQTASLSPQLVEGGVSSGVVTQPTQQEAKPAKQPGSLFELLQLRKQQREAAILAAKPRPVQKPQAVASLSPQQTGVSLGTNSVLTDENIATAAISADGNPARAGDPAALPGVSTGDQLFGITHEDGEDEEESNSYQVAALGSLGRRSPNGIRTQTEKVVVGCFGPDLVNVLQRVETHYGRPVVVTSGFRDSRSNRQAGGARKSMHVLCKAADIQIEGVSKWDLAKYLRTVAGRGGVGTYCRTDSVHIDTGPERDWHHPCRRSKKKTRKA